ncbi:hypothetical protein ScPMuIL_003326 [Solemya velum]
MVGFTLAQRPTLSCVSLSISKEQFQFGVLSVVAQHQLHLPCNVSYKSVRGHLSADSHCEIFRTETENTYM